MTPTYHSSFPPFTIDLNEDHHHHDQQQLLFCSETATEDAPSSSSISYPIFINPPREEVGYFHTQFQPFHHPEEGNTHASPGESWDHPMPNWSEQKLSVCKKEEKTNYIEDQRESSSFKWMPSKMRLMKKKVTVDQTVNITIHQAASIHKFEDEGKKQSSPSQHHNINKNLSANGNNSIRVCADCNTTKTPLWRSGPRGPKSLCNACGIRQRKARRAMAAAAQASANGAIFASDTAAMKTTNNKVQNKENKTNNSLLPFKKRCKFASQSKSSKKKLCFEDLSSIILSKNSAFQHPFPQDEKEAAILLMALSYGTVHG